MSRLLLILGLMLMVAFPAVPAEERSRFGPEVPKGTGEAHPEGNAYWRRQHMEMMLHDRDRTVYDGDRDVTASLSGCFDCHAVKDEAGQPVVYQDKRHFCRTCHDYAAVKVDCFMCHRSTPEGFAEPLPRAYNSFTKD